MDTSKTLQPEFIKTLENSGNSYSFGAAKIQQRRHPEWVENYQLYRLKVQTNRLTQRQSVVMPLMKETIKTGLAKHKYIDIGFSDIGQDDQSSIDFNEYWEHVVKNNKLFLKDKQDAKQEALYGRTFMKMGIVDGEVMFSVEDPIDITVDQFADPADINGTANFMEHRHIFRSMSYIKGNKYYDPKGIQLLKEKLSGTENTIIEDGERAYDSQAQTKMASIGESNPLENSVGDVFVEMREQYIKYLDPEDGKNHIFLRIVAEGITLYIVRLSDELGIDFFPFITWASDLERTDIWSDGVADIVRVPNKILNSWLSQLVENRTLRNLGMYFYDATADETWVPQNYDPISWGWYGVPGDPNKVAKRMDIPELSESLDEMNFLIGSVERATAATAMEKGVTEQGNMTLGEIKIVTQNAKDRLADSVEYRLQARLEMGEKVQKLIVANKNILNPVKRSKKGFDGKVYQHDIDPKTFSDKGYFAEVVILDDQKAKDLQSLQMMQGVSGLYPNNIPLKRILQSKALNIIDGLSKDEKDEILQFQKSLDEKMAQGNTMAPAPAPATAPAPSPSPELTNINQ